MSDVKDAILKHRVELDALANFSFSKRSPEIGDYSNEIAAYRRKVLFAKAWLGKALGELKVETPYKNNGKRKTAADIEKTAQQASEEALGILNAKIKNDGSGTRVGTVDALRQLVGEQVAQIKEILPINVSTFVADNVIRELCEARFWLGFELERIRLIENRS